MKSLEYSNEPINKKKTKENLVDEDEDENDLIKRYEVEEKKPLNSFYLLDKKNKKRLPLLFYVFIFSLLLLIAFVVYFIVILINKKQNFTIEDNPIDKPPLSNYSYSKITFNNGLEVLLVQINENDMAGGSIVFDTGKLDNQFKYINLNSSLRSLDIINKTSPDFFDYLGEIKNVADDYHSYISFNILNDGFFKFLKNFTILTYFEKDDNRLVVTQLNNSRIPSNMRNLTNITMSRNKEKDILEYLIYGYKYVDFGQRYNQTNNSDTIKIMKSLINPKKMKIVLASHFKISLMKKKFLKYFNNIINAKTDEEQDKDDLSFSYNENNFKTKQLIYYKIRDYETNYLQINFFVNKEKKEDYYQFSQKLGYFNYLKYILEQTNEGSLYHYLTSTSEYSIKSLYCDFEIVLKSKIRFLIKINLAPSSYEYFDEIFYKVYEYINKLIKIDFKYNISLEEIKTINQQKFNLEEDKDNMMEFTKNLGINLCNKKKKEEFLKSNWIDSFDLEIAKQYYSKLTPDNSVLIIALNEEGKNKINLKINEYKNTYLDFEKNKLFVVSNDIPSLEYSINSFKPPIKFNENIYININKNNYISKYMEPIQIDFEDLIKNRSETKELNKTNRSEFRFLKDTTFRIPKVFIIINIYHPFFRPGNVDNKDCFYFDYMIYLTYIQREINITLADAIRAGNKIKANYDNNCIYIDVIAFSDVAESIIIQIQKIISDDSKFSEIFENKEKFNLYMQSALEDNLNVNKINIDVKARYLLYYSLNKNMFKNYEFNKDYNNTIIIDQKCNDIFKEYSNLVTQNNIYCLIYGNYNETQANRIVDILNKHQGDSFNNVLDSVKLNIKEDNFIDWMIYQDLSFINNKTIKNDSIKSNDSGFKNHMFIYIYFSNYNITNKILISIYKKMIGHKNRENNGYSLTFDIHSYNGIYLVIHVHSYRNTIDKYFYEENIKNNIIKIIEEKKDNYTARFDVVGNRFYYIIKNIINQQYLKSNDMESKVKILLNSQLYASAVDVNDELSQKEIKELKKMTYDELIMDFKDIINNYTIFIEYNYSISS